MASLVSQHNDGQEEKKEEFSEKREEKEKFDQHDTIEGRKRRY
jgi:hypothetical protein